VKYNLYELRADYGKSCVLHNASKSAVLQYMRHEKRKYGAAKVTTDSDGRITLATRYATYYEAKPLYE
jgi:hypothetical protein